MTENEKLFVGRVQIVSCEVHSHCNRTCWFCPNSFIDRRTSTRYLDEAAYLRVLDDLARWGWRGTFSFSRYYEPLSDEIIFERVRQASSRLTGCVFVTSTNGDYVTSEVLERLHRAGLTSLHIQVYCDPKEFGTHFDKLKKRAPELSKVTGGKAHGVYKIQWQTNFKRMAINVNWRDFSKTGSNRAGLQVRGDYQRTAPCHLVSTTVSIDHNGSVMPCCNLRSDFEPHIPYVLGNIRGESVADIYSSQFAEEFRESLNNSAPKRFPCADCSFGI